MKGNVQLLISASVLLVLAGCGNVSLLSDQWTDERGETLQIDEEVEYGKEDYRKIVQANNQLGMELLPEISANENGNKFISPLSLYMALSMLYNGADGKTAAEIADVLNTSLTPEEMSRANASLSMMLANNSESVVLEVANSVWLNEDYDFKESFIKNSGDYFNADVHEIDIGEPASSDEINDWVDDSTNGMIEKMVPKPLNSNLVAILLNAIYFNGKWTLPFEEKNTEDQPFYLENGKSVDLPMMTMDLDWVYLENDLFQAVAMPYGNREATMFVFLPREELPLDEFEGRMTMKNWAEWRQQFSDRYGTLSLPRIELEYGVFLNEPLKALGMETAFAESDLSKMFEQKGPDISKVMQKTALKVDEEGTEAAAVTEIAVAVEGNADGPFEMTVNRPFFLIIEDTETRSILFMGAISNPAP
ncbi:serpin family protein [Planococcus lenghuensis]|uniref:Serpin domain-containing protein n=1 Tax=Planococcus lenghuensis TaxID=2213202 RepID=A0A1Q2KY55_9BACL|nr:serpin family protein [Planococcus lenghuensis]AQQ53119.1 hypothetical protein B0X71_08435 [Planococcus lenghuensis]